MDNLKIKAVLNWPRPRTVKELRGILRLTEYYRKFVVRYSTIAWPLTKQLKKDDFKWNKAGDEAFVRLKRALTTTSVLALSDFSPPLVVETNASGYGLGAILMQHNRMI